MAGSEIVPKLVNSQDKKDRDGIRESIMQVGQLKRILSNPLNTRDGRSEKRQKEKEDVQEKAEIPFRRIFLLVILGGILLGEVIAHSIREKFPIIETNLGQKIRKTSAKTNWSTPTAVERGELPMLSELRGNGPAIQSTVAEVLDLPELLRSSSGTVGVALDLLE